MKRMLDEAPRELTGADASVDEATFNDTEPTPRAAEGSPREEAPDLWPDQVRWMPDGPKRRKEEEEELIA